MSEDTQEQPEQPDSAGGSGGLSVRPRGRADTALIERAIRERWPIPDEKRAELVKRQMDIAASEELSPRECTSAFRSLVSAEKQNLEADRMALELAGAIGRDADPLEAPQAPGQIVNNQQINVYLPDNGRGPDALSGQPQNPSTNGHSNGRST